MSFDVYIIPFRKIGKAQKDHRCMACGVGIPKGSSYYYGRVESPQSIVVLKCCIECFDQILSSPAAELKNIFLDR